MTRSAAALFDLDGTLADTAADLAAALNFVRKKRNLEKIPVSEVRPFASMGARGLLRIGFGLTPQDAEFPALRDAFLDAYDERLCVQTRLFPGMAELIAALGKKNISWGVVTNKSSRFTHRILQALEVSPACVVCGDSTPHLKPHPAPLLLAADKLGRPPGDCVYAGDDLRDIQAARAAGMRPVAVEWGYTSPDNEGPRSWNADAVISVPRELLQVL